ncbi:hypothetical protein GCM10009789_38440 [Kribbella sancticallisti]|uniref:Uncharacterized protein n=1 Tax=Kribbella sancticallisti TaxID=460087 RepID=A0ABN2DQ08_9ACTN
MRAYWTMRLLPVVLALAVSVGLLATVAHSPDHGAGDHPAVSAVAGGHHCSAAPAVGQSDPMGHEAIPVLDPASDSGGHSNVALCLAALLVVIGGLLAGLRLLVSSAPKWLMRRPSPLRVRLESISAVLQAPDVVRLSRLLI